jgi:hypothetical protein
MKKVKDKIEKNKNNNINDVKQAGVAAKISTFIPEIPGSILGNLPVMICNDFLWLSS